MIEDVEALDESLIPDLALESMPSARVARQNTIAKEKQKQLNIDYIYILGLRSKSPTQKI